MNGTVPAEVITPATDPVADLTRAAQEFGAAYRAIGTAELQKPAGTGVADARRARALTMPNRPRSAVTVSIEDAKAAARVSGQAFVSQVTTLVGLI